MVASGSLGADAAAAAERGRIDPKVIAALVNRFVADSSEMMQAFARQAEVKLNTLTQRIHRLERLLQLLETKLAHFEPGGFVATVRHAPQKSQETLPDGPVSTEPSSTIDAPAPSGTAPGAPVTNDANISDERCEQASAPDGGEQEAVRPKVPPEPAQMTVMEAAALAAQKRAARVAAAAAKAEAEAEKPERAANMTEVHTDRSPVKAATKPIGPFRKAAGPGLFGGSLLADAVSEPVPATSSSLLDEKRTDGNLLQEVERVPAAESLPATEALPASEAPPAPVVKLAPAPKPVLAPITKHPETPLPKTVPALASPTSIESVVASDIEPLLPPVTGGLFQKAASLSSPMPPTKAKGVKGKGFGKTPSSVDPLEKIKKRNEHLHSDDDQSDVSDF